MKEKEFEKYIQQDSWFHGTTLINWKRICASGVRADYNKGLESDFGYGFYLTPKYEQAKSYITRMLPYLHSDEKDKVPVVIEFELNLAKLIDEEFSYAKFLNFDESFAKFVANCRLHPQVRIHNYDFVVGVMSDSNPLKLIDDYRRDLISMDDVLAGLLKGNSMQQLCLHNQSICDTLIVKKVYNLIEEKEEDANDYNKRFF